MTNHLAKLSNAEHNKRVLMTVVVISIQMLSSGCGIPELRQALPGPALPASSNDANNLQYFRGNPAAEYMIDGVQSEDVDDTNLLASITQPTGHVVLNRDSASDESTTILASYVDALNEVDFKDDDNAGTNLDLIAPYPDDESADADGAGPELYDADPDSDAVGVIMDNEPGVVEVGMNSWENTSHIPLYEFFNDPTLINLIDQALIGNQELKMLSEEIRIANFEIMARQGAYLPFVTVGAGAGIDKPGRYTRAGAVGDQLNIRRDKPFPEPLPDFLVAANLSWQLDIWRELRNARDAATMHYLGTYEGQNYVVTRLVAEIAENYYELLALDNRLEILDQTIKIQEQSLKVAEANKAAGRATELAVQRFLAEVRKNQSEKLIIHQKVIEVENRINFLVGRYPQHIARDSSGYIDLNMHPLGVGVPAQLLHNRADIRQAERELAAAGLNVKVARARFYPTLDLSAGVGYQAFNPQYLFTTPASLIYGVAGDLVAPLINKKAIKADYLSANAAQLQKLYDYQRTILNAYTEVVNRMSKVENYGQSIKVKKLQLAALDASVDSATKLFQNARVEYVDVLLAQRDLMEARMVLVETKQQQLSAIVNAYQALGGGGVQMSVQ